MTKSTITREESIQAVFDLKVGYTLGLADIEILKRVARMALAAMDSSESVELTLDYLHGHKDGLEWAARLAEANHPETGDWLYDDPIELAKAIRKGPDMPPVQPAPVVQCPFPCGWDNLNKLAIHDAALVARGLVEGELTTEAHRQAAISNNDRLLKVISACRAAMLAAAPQSPGSEPATVPGKWIPVSERMPEDRKQVILWDAEIGEVTSGHYSHKKHTFYHCGDAIENEITHWMPTPAAPQEVIHG
ncbi:Eaa1 [Klebsiella pneumoniae]|uniref:DUF551 domain-containing protein n=1 Tax=Klebsiella pneumoniae TaxID=573 RepID=UPI0010E13CBF|nr:DUF551 domain-containing protein [Klebsiella pneumoniae]VGB68556.1 Eaa1 [Klebsiella pneumoniae]